MAGRRTPASRHGIQLPCGLAASLWIVLLGYLSTVDAAFVEFRNCLSRGILDSNPQLLQFVPLNVSVTFDVDAEFQPLNIIVYGNVTGKLTDEPYPPPNDPHWGNPEALLGKIPDFEGGNPAYTTLLGAINVLSYTPYTIPAVRFCNSTLSEQCPIGPAFFIDPTDLPELPSFSVQADLNSSYSFTSLSAQLRILSGSAQVTPYGCVVATITPDLGATLKDLLTYLPLAILIMVGVATIAAATLSPWGTADIFKWTSNFGRDEDLLRLVTPGFADCLQYIQFIVLTGSLSLNYPGFYQPAISGVSWSSLMFNRSLVSGEHTQVIVDGIYQYGTSSDYGLDRMQRLVGMDSSRDVWPGMMLWLVVIVAIVSILTQLAFAFRWLYRQVAKVDAEDLRSKNGPFTIGNVVRVCLNFFIIPLTSLSFYQLGTATRGPAYSVAIASLVIVAIILFAVRLLLLFMRIRPRSFLFDDLVTVLIYGPLYNTYCDDAAMFALVPVFVNLLRGLAIGAVQASGIAQVVILAACEIVLILTTNAFRPFPSATSMNIYHTCFAAIRFVTILLSIAFVPSLDVDDGSRGWIGYAILLVHACVLVFGFFLNAIQTLVEVFARLAGAGTHSDASGGAARGGLVKVFGMRQLSRREPRHAHQAPRSSMASNAAMLERMESGPKDLNMSRTRTRSVSASSTMLLQQARANPNRMSHTDAFSAGQTTPDASSTMSKRMANRFSGQSGGAHVGAHRHNEKKDPYYRPPRRNTMDPLNSPGNRSSAEWSNAKARLMDEEAIVDDDAVEVMTPGPSRRERDELEDSPADASKPKKDYAVREVDFYYGVRGPALSSGNRRLKTGPADPTGPVSSATGFFKNLFGGGKTKEKHKGFEVVRSARAPPPGLIPPTPDPDSGAQEPYEDDPQSPAAARQGRSNSLRSVTERQVRTSIYEDDSAIEDSDVESEKGTPIPTRPPSLPLINTVGHMGDIELPRIGSERSKKSRRRQELPADEVPAVPAIPRRSSRRNSSRDLDVSQSPSGRNRLAPVQGSPSDYRGSKATGGSTNRLPFTSTQAASSKFNRYSTGGESFVSDYMQAGDDENMAPESYTHHLRQTSSALGNHAAADRPSSVGFVPHHRASDHIHHSPDSPDFEGSVAEVLGRPGPRRYN